VGWAALSYLLVVIASFTVTAVQASWGGPVWWPVAEGLVALVACSAVGFALGRLVPSRFTAPMAAVGAFVVLYLGTHAALAGWRVGLLTPLYPCLGLVDSARTLASSVFYPIHPDLAWIQILCGLGVLGLALAATTLPVLAERPAIRRAGAALLVAGLAALRDLP
jgi:hypothetical protein